MSAKNLLKQVYQENFLQLRDSFSRTTGFSHTLVAFQLIQLQGIFLKADILNQYSTSPLRGIISGMIWLLESFKIYPIFQLETKLNQIYFLLVNFIITLCMILLLGLFLLFKMQKSKQKFRSKIKGLFHFETIQQPIAFIAKFKMPLKITEIITVIISFFLQSYKYILHWTVIDSSLQNIYSILIQKDYEILDWINLTGIVASIVVLILFVFMDVFLMFHTFDYKFKNKDMLGEKESNLKILLHLYIYVSIIIMIFTQSSYPYLQIFFGFIFTLYCLLLSTLQFIYRMSILNNYLSIILGQFIFIYIGIFFYMLKIFSDSHINDLILLSSPILFQIQLLVRKYQMKNNLSLENKNDKNIEVKLRTIYSLIKITFQQDWTIFRKPVIRYSPSIELFSLAANHLRNCSGYYLSEGKQNYSQRKCFCREYFPISEQQTSKYLITDMSHQVETRIFSFNNEKQFKSFLYDLIKYHFERQLNQKEILESNGQFSYVYFLIQIIKRPTKAFYEAMNLKLSTKQISQKKRMIIQQLILDAKLNFDLMIERKSLINQKYNFKQVFEFDQQMDYSKFNFLTILQNYKKWYNSLLSQQLHLENIFQKGSILYTQIVSFEKQLLSLYYLNPLSVEIDTIISLFYKYLNFNIKRPKATKRDSPYANTFIQSINQQVFQNDSCVIYLSLMNSRGSIQNYTKSFKSLILGNDSEIKNENIKKFMPDSIAYHHDFYLDNFIELGRMNIVMAEQRFLLVKNTQQFIIPVFAKVRLENYSNDDFGSSALITKINESFYYSVISKYGLVEEVSQNFYDDILHKTLALLPQELKYLNFIRIMPCLLKDLSILESKQIDNDIDFEFQGDKKDQIQYDLLLEGHIIIPKAHCHFQSILQTQKVSLNYNLQEYLKYQQKQNQIFYQNITNFHMFVVKYKIRLMKTINSIINILEIQNLRIIKSDFQEKALKDVQSLCNLDYEAQKRFSTKTRIKQFENMTLIQIDQQKISLNDLNQEQEEYNLEDQFIVEDQNMVQQKQRNVEEYYYPRNNQTTILNSADSQVQRGFLETNVSNLIQQRKSSSQMQNILKEEHQSVEYFNNSLNSNSSSSQKIQQEMAVQQDGASSIGSSQSYNDYLSKRRVLREVLYSDHQYSNNVTKITILILSMILLTALYSINFIFVLVTWNSFGLIELNKHHPNNILNSFNSYIIASELKWQDLYNSEWYLQFQAFSAQNYQISIEPILNEENAILNMQFFSEQCKYKIILESVFLMDEKYSSTLDQLFLYKLVAEQMIQEMSRYHIAGQSNTNFLTNNFEIIVNSMMLKLNSSIIDNIEQLILRIESQQNLIIIFSEVTLSIIVMILFPVLLMINSQKNTILQFFTTFPQFELQQQHETYTMLSDRLEETKFTSTETNQFDIESLHIKRFAKRIKTMKDSNQIKQTQSKLRKAVGSSATPIIIFNVILGLFLFSIVSAYFISSYFIKSNFLGQYRQLNSQVYIFQAIMIEMLKENSIQNIILSSIIQSNFTEISDSPVMTLLWNQKDSNFSTLAFYTKQLTEGLPNYDSQIYEIITSNICAIFSNTLVNTLKNQQYLQFFTYSTCESFGSLQQGISIVLNDFMNQLLQFYTTIFSHLNEQKSFENLPSELLLLINSEQQYIYFYTSFALQVMIDQEDDLIQNNIQNSFSTQIITFILCAIFIAIFSLVVEKYIKNLISNYINQSKLLLTLIPFEILQTNAYVMTYVIQESKKINA